MILWAFGINLQELVPQLTKDIRLLTSYQRTKYIVALQFHVVVALGN